MKRLACVELFCLAIFGCGYWLGRRTFLHLQALDSQNTEITVPQILDRALAKAVPKNAGPFVSLLKKELHLQRLVFLLAALFCVVSPIEAVFWKLAKSDLASNIALGILSATFVIYLLMLPLVAAGGCVAEERNWGMLGWQLTLPPSRLKQWTAKILVVFATCWLLGFFLPLTFFRVGNWLFHFSSDHSAGGRLWIFPDWQFLSYYSIAVGLIIFTSSISTTSFRAIFLGLGLVIGCISLVSLGIYSAHTAITYYFLDHTSVSRHSYIFQYFMSIIFWLIIAALLCLILFLAWLNYSKGELSSRRAWICSGIIIFYCFGAAFTWWFLVLLSL